MAFAAAQIRGTRVASHHGAMPKMPLDAVALIAGCSRPTREPAPAPLAIKTGGPSAASVERGRYVSAIAGCTVCHTPELEGGAPDMARELAGGREEHLPGIGVWRSLNITPDRDTGIGRWTDQQVIDA